MAEDIGDNIIWHPETITTGTAETLRTLRDGGFIGDAYLAGGTALALRFGHRLSVDLDFFTPELFHEDALLARLQTLPEFSLVAKSPHTIHAVIHGTKVSFLGYPYRRLFPLSTFEGVPVADPRDIACMKLSAIASRGTKRDFIDLYVVGERFSLGDILNSARSITKMTSAAALVVVAQLLGGGQGAARPEIDTAVRQLR